MNNDENTQIINQMMAHFNEQNKRISRLILFLFLIILCLFGYILYDRHLDSQTEDNVVAEISQTIDNDK